MLRLVLSTGNRKRSRITNAKSLRAIGQSLEINGVPRFTIENDRRGYYTVTGDSLTKAAEWIWGNSLSKRDLFQTSAHRVATIQSLYFTPFDISRLDTRGRKQRKNSFVAGLHETNFLSRLLRTLGDYLDSVGAIAFRIFLKADSIGLDWKDCNGKTDFGRLQLGNFTNWIGIQRVDGH